MTRISAHRQAFFPTPSTNWLLREAASSDPVAAHGLASCECCPVFPASQLSPRVTSSGDNDTDVPALIPQWGLGMAPYF